MNFILSIPKHFLFTINQYSYFNLKHILVFQYIWCKLNKFFILVSGNLLAEATTINRWFNIVNQLKKKSKDFFQIRSIKIWFIKNFYFSNICFSRGKSENFRKIWSSLDCTHELFKTYLICPMTYDPDLEKRGHYSLVFSWG